MYWWLAGFQDLKANHLFIRGTIAFLPNWITARGRRGGTEQARMTGAVSYDYPPTTLLMRD
jgi:hypothetical protein